MESRRTAMVRLTRIVRLFASRPASMNLTHFYDVVRLGLVQ